MGATYRGPDALVGRAGELTIPLTGCAYANTIFIFYLALAPL
jgi:hypothetical protein